jgi:hypothetical protein
LEKRLTKPPVVGGFIVEHRRILPFALFPYDAIRDESSSFAPQFPFLIGLIFAFSLLNCVNSYSISAFPRHPIGRRSLSKMGDNERKCAEVKKESLRMLIHLELNKAKR